MLLGELLSSPPSKQSERKREGLPMYLISTPGDMADEEFERVKQEIIQHFRSPRRVQIIRAEDWEK